MSICSLQVPPLESLSFITFLIALKFFVYIRFLLPINTQAGSLTNLAKAPASTVQILGAEKALFRALKTKGNTPKYGLIYHSSFIGRAGAKNKGRISRYLANKCAIATRIDSFSDDPPSHLYGAKLRDQVEERLQFYETGKAPRRNLDVMQEASREIAAAKKSSGDSGSGDKGNVGMDDDDDDVSMSSDKKEKKKASKKEKKRKQSEGGDAEDQDGGDEKSAKKAKKEDKKKKKKSKK
jgi:nucleolar protein 56